MKYRQRKTKPVYTGKCQGSENRRSTEECFLRGSNTNVSEESTVEVFGVHFINLNMETHSFETLVVIYRLGHIAPHIWGNQPS